MTAFAGRRYGLSEGEEFELLRICLSSDCKFSAAKSRVPDYVSSDKQTRVAKHVSRFAFTDKTAASAPCVDIPVLVRWRGRTIPPENLRRV